MEARQAKLLQRLVNCKKDHDRESELLRNRIARLEVDTSYKTQATESAVLASCRGKPVEVLETDMDDTKRVFVVRRIQAVCNNVEMATYIDVAKAVRVALEDQYAGQWGCAVGLTGKFRDSFDHCPGDWMNAEVGCLTIGIFKVREASSLWQSALQGIDEAIKKEFWKTFNWNNR